MFETHTLTDNLCTLVVTQCLAHGILALAKYFYYAEVMESQISKSPSIDLILHWTDGKYFHYSASQNNVINFDGNNECSTLEQCPLSSYSFYKNYWNEEKEIAQEPFKHPYFSLSHH